MKIKKISQPLNVEGAVIDSLESNSATNAPSIKAVNEAINVTDILVAGEDLDNYKKAGVYFFSSTYEPLNIPEGTDGWLVVYNNKAGSVKQIWYRMGSVANNSFHTFVRTCGTNGVWSSWKKLLTDDEAYPIGSVYVSSTNDDPKSKLGGTWELINKEFKATHFYSTDVSTISDYLTMETDMTFNTLAIIRNTNTIFIRLYFTTGKELNDDTINVGTLNLQNLGTDALWLGLYSLPATSDGGNGIAFMNVNASTGVISVVDVVAKGEATTIASGSQMLFDFRIEVPQHKMIDSFCDKFYWKRTA